MTKKILDKRAMKSYQKNISPMWVRVVRIIGAVVAVTAIVHLAVQGIWYLKTGNYYGHLNYWNQPVGTLLIASIIMAIMLVCIIKGIKHLSNKKRRR
jgi:uncharacterized membrane protein